MRRASFLENNRLDPITGCWNWTGALSPKGYGHMRYLGRHEGVHRISAHCYLNFDLKSTLHVLHRCDNPACFNPKHLFIGTNLDNVRDCIAKKRRSEHKLTRCAQGHPYEVDNILFIGGEKQHRRCRTCAKERHRIEYLKRKSLGLTLPHRNPQRRRKAGTLRCPR